MTYHVTPSTKSGWLVQRNRSHISKHRKKERAVDKARQLARKNNSRVVVHGTGGQILNQFRPR